MVQVTLGGQDYALVPTAGAMRAIEQLGELTLVEMFQAHVAHRLRLEEVAGIVYQGLVAASNPDAFSFSAVLDRVFELRVTNETLHRQVGEYLVELLYHPDDAGKREAAMTFLEHGGQGSDQST